ncbi:MAG TPA: PQQ-binding-like beta-propeller repeat protein [Cellulomonas sp.]
MRRRRNDVVVFDLDATAAPEPDEVPGAPHEHAGRTDGVRRRLREAAAASAVVVVALAAWGVTAAVHEHQRVTRLAASPGGVLSLAHAPTVRWSAATDSSDATAFMPGLVVVRRGTVLHGLDAASGADRWQVEVGGDPVCGLSAWGQESVAVVDPLVCWGGPNADRSTVTVVRADGTSSTRDLDGPVDAAAGAPDGGVVTVRRTGPKPPAPPVAATPTDNGGYTASGSMAQGQDAVVRLEDATTGELRWERTVPFRPVADVSTCGAVQVDGDTATVDVTSLSIATYPSFVQIHACGLDAGFTLSGELTTAADASAWSWPQPYVDGGVLEQVGAYSADQSVASVLHGPDGSVVGRYTAQVLQPWATDGTGSDVVLAGSGGVPLQAFSRDGTVRWRSIHTYPEVLVRTAGVIVAARDDLAISGLDPGTGGELWTDDHLLADDPAAGSRDFVRNAFTDGSVALLVLGHDDEDDAFDLVALDLATGGVRWRAQANGSWPSFAASEGRLVQIVGNEGTRYVEDGDGRTVRIDPGTVTALG